MGIFFRTNVTSLVSSEIQPHIYSNGTEFSLIVATSMFLVKFYISDDFDALKILRTFHNQNGFFSPF